MAADLIDRLVHRYAAKKPDISLLSDGGFTGNGLRGIFGNMQDFVFLIFFASFVSFP